MYRGEIWIQDIVVEDIADERDLVYEGSRVPLAELVRTMLIKSR